MRAIAAGHRRNLQTTQLTPSLFRRRCQQRRRGEKLGAIRPRGARSSGSVDQQCRRDQRTLPALGSVTGRFFQRHRHKHQGQLPRHSPRRPLHDCTGHRDHCQLQFRMGKINNRKSPRIVPPSLRSKACPPHSPKSFPGDWHASPSTRASSTPTCCALLGEMAHPLIKTRKAGQSPPFHFSKTSAPAITENHSVSREPIHH